MVQNDGEGIALFQRIGHQYNVKFHFYFICLVLSINVLIFFLSSIKNIVLILKSKSTPTFTSPSAPVVSAKGALIPNNTWVGALLMILYT
jgi:hypothetical protein